MFSVAVIISLFLKKSAASLFFSCGFMVAGFHCKYKFAFGYYINMFSKYLLNNKTIHSILSRICAYNSESVLCHHRWTKTKFR